MKYNLISAFITKCLLISILFIHLACQNQKSNLDYTNWAEYLGGPDRNHYSELNQITPQNVHQLQVAWTYALPDSGQMQMNPIIVEGILYGVSASVQAFALDAATGKEIWRFGDSLKAWHSTSRGVAYWAEGDDKRVLYTIGPHLYALNAKNGQLIESFGDKGRVDLHTSLPESAKDKFIISNTPGTIFENLIIMPVRVSEDVDAAPGDIRAFDVKTGKLAWSFKTIPSPNEFGGDTWDDQAHKNIDVGGANNWAGMAIDRERGILYVPTGSAAPDFYGGKRLGQNLFANCLLALNAKNGQRIWHYQFTHHDIWDRDLPAPPNLLTVKKNGKEIAAVAQITKQGYVFVFDRQTGESLFPIEEIKVPNSDLKGEKAWPTQPLPTLPKPFARQITEITEKDISPYAENKAELLEIFKKSDKRMFAPPSLAGVLLLPGYDGGGEWGGAAADPKDGIIYINSNEMAWILKVDSVQVENNVKVNSLGESIYLTYCAACHQKDRSGNAKSGFPNLQTIGKQRTRAQINAVIGSGKGMMPGFPQIKDKEKQALVDFLMGDDKQEVGANSPKKYPLPFKHSGYKKFLDNKGLPGLAPPWGTLNALDLNTGEYLWKIPLGDAPELKNKNLAPTGIENYGGPIVTANGLLFIGATKDGKMRAFDKKTGKLLWQTQLPAAAFATPATYMVNGKQYVVIACGGEKLGTPKGNKIVAFALK